MIFDQVPASFTDAAAAIDDILTEMTSDARALFSRDPLVVAFPDVECPPLTDEGVAYTESVLGLRLPASFVALLRVCNGGYITRNACPTTTATSWADNHVHVASISGIPNPSDEPGPYGVGRGILQTPYMVQEWGLPDRLVLIDGDGHTWSALDYRDRGNDEEPGVVWLDVELGQEVRLANSFAEFLERLRPEDEFE